MGAALLDAVAVHDDDLVGVFDGGQAVGNHDGGAVFAQLVQRILDVVFSHVVQRRGCLVENQNRWILQKDAGNRDTLLLTAGQLDAAFTDKGIVAFRQAHDVVVDVGFFSCLVDLLAAGSQLAVGDVVKDGAGEEENILLHDADFAAQRTAGDLADVLSVDADAALGDFVKTRNQMTEGGFAAAGRSDDGDHLALREGHRDVGEDLLALIVLEGNVVEGNLAADILQIDCIGRFLFYLDVHQLLEAGVAGDGVLEHLDKLDELFDWVDKHIDEQHISDHVTDVDDAAVDAVATAGQHNDVHQRGQKVGAGEEFCHDSVGAFPHGDIALVVFIKFFSFLLLAGEGTGNTHAGDAVFQAGVDLCNLNAVFAEGDGHCSPLFDDKQNQEGEDGKGDQGQRDIDGTQDDEGTDHADQRDEQVLGTVVGKLGDVHQVVDDARHDDAGFVFVKVGKGQLLQVLKDVPAHIRLHPHADHMTLILHEILHDCLHQVDDQQRNTPGQDEPQVFVRDVGVDDVSGDDRIHQIAAGGN